LTSRLGLSAGGTSSDGVDATSTSMPQQSGSQQRGSVSMWANKHAFLLPAIDECLAYSIHSDQLFPWKRSAIRIHQVHILVIDIHVQQVLFSFHRLQVCVNHRALALI
jgi:hypothetical protein